MSLKAACLEPCSFEHHYGWRWLFWHAVPVFDLYAPCCITSWPSCCLVPAPQSSCVQHHSTWRAQGCVPWPWTSQCPGANLAVLCRSLDGAMEGGKKEKGKSVLGALCYIFLVPCHCSDELWVLYFYIQREVCCGNKCLDLCLPEAAAASSTLL